MSEIVTEGPRCPKEGPSCTGGVCGVCGLWHCMSHLRDGAKILADLAACPRTPAARCSCCLAALDRPESIAALLCLACRTPPPPGSVECRSPEVPGECSARECDNWPMYHFRTRACPPAPATPSNEETTR